MEAASTELYYEKLGNRRRVTPKVTPSGAVLLINAAAFDLLITWAVLTGFNMPVFCADSPISPMRMLPAAGAPSHLLI